MEPAMTFRNVAFALMVAGVLTSCAGMRESLSGQQIVLSGNNEVPPIVTPATGTGTVNIDTNRHVSATVDVIGMTPNAAHIHEGAPGTNGPVIVPFIRITAQAFGAPAGAQLTEAQYASYKAGNLYVNVHSAKHPGGEVRAQIAGR